MSSFDSHPLARVLLPTAPLVAVRENRASMLEVLSAYLGIILLLVSYAFSLEQWQGGFPLVIFCWLVLIGYSVALGNIVPWGLDKKGTNRYLEVSSAVMVILLVILANPTSRIFSLLKATSNGQCARMATQEWSLCLSGWALYVNALGCLCVIAALAATLRNRRRANAPFVN